MLLSVNHTTRYAYSTEVARRTQYIRLTPNPGAMQRTVDWAVELPAASVTMRDAFDNLTHLLVIDRPHTEIGMVARGTVDVSEVDDGEPAGKINPKVFLRSTRLTDADDAIRAFVEPMRGVARSRPLIGVSDLILLKPGADSIAIGSSSRDGASLPAESASVVSRSGGPSAPSTATRVSNVDAAPLTKLSSPSASVALREARAVARAQALSCI